MELDALSRLLDMFETCPFEQRRNEGFSIISKIRHNSNLFIICSDHWNGIVENPV